MNTGILFLVMCIYAILAVDFFMNYGVDAGPMKASKEAKKIVGARVWRIEGPFEMPTKVWQMLRTPIEFTANDDQNSFKEYCKPL